MGAPLLHLGIVVLFLRVPSKAAYSMGRSRSGFRGLQHWTVEIIVVGIWDVSNSARSAEPRPFRVSHNVTARAVTTHLLPRAPSRSSPNAASSVRPRVPPSRHPAWLKRTPPATLYTEITMGEPDLSNTLYLCSQIRQVL